MKCAMDPVLDKVGQKHDGGKLDEKGKGPHPLPHACKLSDRKKPLCGNKGEKGQNLHEQAAHQVAHGRGQRLLPPAAF